MCERELTDALAAARRELAEAAPDKAVAIRMKLNDLAAKAKKWNVEAKVPARAGHGGAGRAGTADGGPEQSGSGT